MCTKKHIKHRWCSQPLLNMGLHSGDLMLSAAILSSGNNFSKVALMARFMKLHFPSQSSFTRMQRTYLVPAIDETWEEHLEIIRRDFTGKDVVLLGKHNEMLNVLLKSWSVLYKCWYWCHWLKYCNMNFILVFFRRWSHGQSWALCSILYIYHDGKQHKENCGNENFRQKRDGKEEYKFRKSRISESFRRCKSQLECHRSCDGCTFTNWCFDE